MSDLNKFIDQWEKYQKELAANGNKVSSENDQDFNKDDEYDFLDDSNLMLTEEEKKNSEIVTNKVINHYWDSLHEKMVNETKKVIKENSLNEVKKNIKKDVEKRVLSDNPVNLDAMGADQDPDAIYKNDGGPHYDPSLLAKLAKLKAKLYDLESDFNSKTTDEVAKAKLDKIQKNIESLKKEIEDLSV